MADRPSYVNDAVESQAKAAKSSTDALIAQAKFAYPDLDSELVDRCVPEAIDAMYAARDAGLSMHHAGSIAAVTVLRIVHDLRRLA